MMFGATGDEGRSASGDHPRGRVGPRARSAVSLLTGADRIVLYVLVGLGLVLLLAPHRDTRFRRVFVEGPGGQREIVGLNEERTLDVDGPLGTTRVVVSGGAVRIVSSPCPRGICVAIGPIDSPGESAVCVPNRVVVRVVGGSATDATTR